MMLSSKAGLAPCLIVIQNPNALKIGQFADILPNDIQKILLTLVKREVRLQRILKSEANTLVGDLSDNLDS